MMISAAVEGIVDDAVVRRILAATLHEAGPIHVKSGKANLLQRLDGYNAAAQISPWLVLLDLNGDETCAPTFVSSRLPTPSEHMMFRLAVRQVEAWLLADRARIASFLRVSQARVPLDPESLRDAKEALITIARNSSDRVIRDGLVPPHGSGRKVGPAYVATIIEFIERRWDPRAAARTSDSLKRCMDRLRSLQR